MAGVRWRRTAPGQDARASGGRLTDFGPGPCCFWTPLRTTGRTRSSEDRMSTTCAAYPSAAAWIWSAELPDRARRNSAEVDPRELEPTGPRDGGVAVEGQDELVGEGVRLARRAPLVVGVGDVADVDRGGRLVGDDDLERDRRGVAPVARRRRHRGVAGRRPRPSTSCAGPVLPCRARLPGAGAGPPCGRRRKPSCRPTWPPPVPAGPRRTRRPTSPRPRGGLTCEKS